MRWLPKLEAGGVELQVCPLYAATAPPEEARGRALAQARAFARAIDENGDHVFQVRSSGDLDGEDRIGLMLSMEGSEALEGDPAAFDEFYELGVRVVGLTWNYVNEFAGGIEDQTRGLTDKGRELVGTFAERGVVLDLAHASDQTWRDALELDARIVVTHAGCRAIRDHPRNLADWQLEALAERDGVLGLMALALVVDPDAPTLDRYVDHIDYAVSTMGIEHVGLGADFIDQVAETEREFGVAEDMPPAMVEAFQAGKSRFGLEDFTGPDHYPLLVNRLRERGYDGEGLRAIVSSNWLGVFGGTLVA